MIKSWFYPSNGFYSSNGVKQQRELLKTFDTFSTLYLGVLFYAHAAQVEI